METKKEGAFLAALETDELRGKIINQSLYIESFADRALAWFFVNDKKRRQYFDIAILNGEFGLSGKINCLIFLIKTITPNIYSKYPELSQDAKSFIGTRNQAAHRVNVLKGSWLDDDYGQQIHFSNVGINQRHNSKESYVAIDDDYLQKFMKSAKNVREAIDEFHLYNLKNG